MPVERGTERLRTTPWATWGLAALIAAVSFLSFTDLPATITSYGLIPAQYGRYGGLTFLTSFLLHGGALHLATNIYFLLVFGDNVEDLLGKRRFLVLIACAALVGDVVHIGGDPGSTTPCVGASGGIAGALAFYALAFPRVRLRFLLRVYLWFRWVSLPAYVLFLIWLVTQFLGSWAQLAGFSNVSSLAHLGGAGVGVLFWLTGSGNARFRGEPRAGWRGGLAGAAHNR